MKSADLPRTRELVEAQKGDIGEKHVPAAQPPCATSCEERPYHLEGDSSQCRNMRRVCTVKRASDRESARNRRSIGVSGDKTTDGVPSGRRDDL